MKPTIQHHSKLTHATKKQMLSNLSILKSVLLLIQMQYVKLTYDPMVFSNHLVLNHYLDKMYPILYQMYDYDFPTKQFPMLILKLKE